MVRTRFAPSPTGFLHIGGLRTALYAYALAKHESGIFILRIEDTDQKREVPGAKEKIYQILKKFNLNWDELLVQSDRANQGAYSEAAQILLASDHAFYCQCPPRNAKLDGFSTVLRDPCRDKKLTSGAVKLRIPDNETLKYFDFVLKRDVIYDTNQVADTILLKSDGKLATYHLAVAVDDFFQKITHVLRGPEWISSTPIHILVHRYLDYPLPHIGHLTSILDPQGGKLSKRKGNVSCEQFLADGYLVEALINFVILLGWAPKANQELFSLARFVKDFAISGFQKSNPVFNYTKLNWFNGYYIRQKPDDELVKLVKPFFPVASDELLAKIVPLAKERVTTLADFAPLCQFFITRPVPTPQSRAHLDLAIDQLSAAAWTKEDIESRLVSQVKSREWKVGDFFMTLRLAITGNKITPPLTESMLILGKTECLARLNLCLPNSS